MINDITESLDSPLRSLGISRLINSNSLKKDIDPELKATIEKLSQKNKFQNNFIRFNVENLIDDGFSENDNQIDLPFPC